MKLSISNNINNNNNNNQLILSRFLYGPYFPFLLNWLFRYQMWFILLPLCLNFQGPILQHTRTHLQKSLGDDNVLLVKFADPQTAKKSKTSVQEAANHYGKFGKEGIHVGLRLYRFFGNPVTFKF